MSHFNSNELVVKCELSERERADWVNVSEAIQREGYQWCECMLGGRVFTYTTRFGLGAQSSQITGFRRSGQIWNASRKDW
jgi:hypothetical protein